MNTSITRGTIALPMGYPRGLPRSRVWRKGIGESSSGSSSSSGDGGGGGSGAGGDSTGDGKGGGKDGGGGAVEDDGHFRESPRTARRRRPWLRVVFVLFMALELVIVILVNLFSPVFDFEITSVMDGTTVSAKKGSTRAKLY